MLLAALAAGGCMSLGSVGNEPGRLLEYGVTLAARPVAGAPVAWQLVVEEPAAPTALATARIMLVPENRTYGVYADARWIERVPRLVQGLIVQGFEDSGRIAGVGRTSSGVRGDYALLAELRAFQAEQAGGRTDVVISLSAKFVRHASNDVLAARVFERRVEAGGRDVAATVEAFERALNELVPEIVAWGLATGEANWHAASTAPAASPAPAR
jgi:cholesterol transport system auxiliary component